MKNFKEIAEKCAAGELYGTIILNDGREFYSKYLSQYIFNGQIVEDFYTIVTYDAYGNDLYEEGVKKYER